MTQIDDNLHIFPTNSRYYTDIMPIKDENILKIISTKTRETECKICNCKKKQSRREEAMQDILHHRALVAGKTHSKLY